MERFVTRLVNGAPRKFLVTSSILSKSSPTVPYELRGTTRRQSKALSRTTTSATGPFANCRLADLSAQFGDLRKTTVALFRNLDEEAWDRRGVANQNEDSVRALAYIIAGHELHHRAILHQKYFLFTFFDLPST